MSEEIGFAEKEGYLLVTIKDSFITTERAHEVLDAIGEACGRLNFNKVLLDERTVERREVPRPDILELGRELPNKSLKKVKIAFCCRKELVNEDAKLLRLFSFTNEFIIQHFNDPDRAVSWLNTSSMTD